MKSITEYIRLLVELNKLRITIIVTLTTLAGYTLAAGTIDQKVALPLLGIFILACGSAALNQFQERDKDILMNRTKTRPIPSGNIKPLTALIIAIIEIGLGTWIVYVGNGFEAAFLGFMAFVWYNLIYTPLKRITAFAVIPGSVIGAIPPMVGWVAGGGTLHDPRLYIMAFFFFMSQAPHFWLLMLKYGEEYDQAGFPVIIRIFNTQQIRRVTFVWIVATALNIILLLFSGLIHTYIFTIVVTLAAVWLIVAFLKLVTKPHEDFNPFKLFMRLNMFLLVIIIAMIVDPLV
ncbi:protoheme IX farnesyltransferase [Parabacteroides sp. FAFU027]|uniref:protoheme IX farnesyltransferase n=1 Tax=Parabacteroides sp. FAFU027 TaxID=2922715 RepID=UPI001FB0336E|nr:protoheme IX farnesyltransferase [Parabacteroides sp. FAFU027]